MADSEAYEKGKRYGVVLSWLVKWAAIFGFLWGVNALLGRSTDGLMHMFESTGLLIAFALADFLLVIIVQAFREGRKARAIRRSMERIATEAIAREILRSASRLRKPSPDEFTITRLPKK